MPKYYCDYCDTYLTHDSPSVRKTHNMGRKHKENVRDYYQKWMEEKAQRLVDQTTAAFKSGKIQPGAFPPRFPMPPPLGMPPMMMPPGNPMMGFIRPPPNLPPPPHGLPPGMPPQLPGMPPMMMPPFPPMGINLPPGMMPQPPPPPPPSHSTEAEVK